jgi:hypothetical protein
MVSVGLKSPLSARDMQEAMTRGVKLSSLGSVHHSGLDNLFIVSEPEAAAACVLAEDQYDIFVSLSDVFIVLVV